MTSWTTYINSTFSKKDWYLDWYLHSRAWTSLKKSASTFVVSSCIFFRALILRWTTAGKDCRKNEYNFVLSESTEILSCNLNVSRRISYHAVKSGLKGSHNLIYNILKMMQLIFLISNFETCGFFSMAAESFAVDWSSSSSPISSTSPSDSMIFSESMTEIEHSKHDVETGGGFIQKTTWKAKKPTTSEEHSQYFINDSLTNEHLPYRKASFTTRWRDWWWKRKKDLKTSTAKACKTFSTLIWKECKKSVCPRIGSDEWRCQIAWNRIYGMVIKS